MKKNYEAEISKKDDENESERKKESEQKKESEKKIESGKNERKTKQWSFYAKASDVKSVFLYKPACICTIVQRDMF